ncbi:MAG: acyltransferase family protein [Clostridiaceae bacterium]
MIDFLRGFAAINIVIIHTAFWSGTQYVPMWFQSLTLLIDVPLFFFIAGWAFSYSNSFEKSLLNVFKTHLKYTVFLALYTIAIFVFHRAEFAPASALNTFFFVFPKENLLLPVVGSSLWFLPVYYCVSIVVSGVIVLITRLSQNQNAASRVLRLLSALVFFLFAFLSLQHSSNGSLQTILFYALFFLLGYLTKDWFVPKLRHLLIALAIVLIGLIGFIVLSGRSGFDLQSAKFPPNLQYFFASLIGISITLYVKKFVSVSPKNAFVWVGKNALYFYLAQGVSSSLLFFVLPAFQGLPWLALFALCAVLNLIGTILLALLLKLISNPLERLFNRLISRAETRT